LASQNAWTRPYLLTSSFTTASTRCQASSKAARADNTSFGMSADLSPNISTQEN